VPIPTFVTDREDQVLDLLRQAEEAIVSAVASVARAVAPLVPELPAVPGRLPTATEVVDASFGFAERLLANQKRFATKLVDAAGPVLSEGATPPPAPKPAPKPAKGPHAA